VQVQHVSALADSIAELAVSLQAVESQLESAAALLRDVSVTAVGPADAGDAVGTVLTRLEGRLSAIAQEAGDGALAVRRHIPEQPT